MTEDEKRNLREEFNENYGLDNSRFPYGLSDVPMDFIRTNLSIQELQPFEETLNDAIIIAGVFGVPPNLYHARTTVLSIIRNPLRRESTPPR